MNFVSLESQDVVCLSHLRWQFVFQRPQHLMVRFARTHRVFFVEEPVFDAADAHLALKVSDGVTVVIPRLSPDQSKAESLATQNKLLRGLFRAQRIQNPLLWFYTPMALPLAGALTSGGVVYDCMDELSGFAGAPVEMRAAEAALLRRADVVFTGGYSLYEAKRDLHSNVHPMPSSVDVPHFAQARVIKTDPADQAAIPRPRVGFCGVIDERMNLGLVAEIARRRPDWQLVMVGPTAKISESDLPRSANIHYLGMKSYAELPRYFAGWDAAIMPFAHNAATRYISPTKTPEYLAAGCPVVSTSIRDVVRPYGERGYVAIADTPESFCEAIDRSLTSVGRGAVARAQSLIQTMSWDSTFERMQKIVARTLAMAPRHEGSRDVAGPLDTSVGAASPLS
jgi:glycosyltransferase involved in cell wall biosynthesis